jgi:hypothetical protein
MRKNIVLAIWFAGLAALVSTDAYAQQTTPSQTTASSTASTSWKFRSDDYLGLAAGQWGNYGLLQTVNGVYKGPWFLGLGAGMDNYRFRSVPLFASVTRDLPFFIKRSGKRNDKRSGLFLNLDGGTNLPWYHRDIIYAGEGWSSKFHAGSWWSAGLGYKWKLAARTDKALLVSLNYSEKRLREVQAFTSPCDPMTCGFGNERYLYEYLNRVFLFAIGFQF